MTPTRSRTAKALLAVAAALACALAAALTAPAQTTYFYGDVECDNPSGCDLINFSVGAGGGLTPAQVDARVKPYARTDGPPIHHTDFDTATETELRDSVPYDGPTFAWPTLTLPAHSGSTHGVEIRDRTAQRNDARLDQLETFEGAIRTTSRLVDNSREVLADSNEAYSLGASISLTGADFDVVVAVTQTGEPDGHLLTTRDALVAAGAVVGDGQTLNRSNGLHFVATPGTVEYRLGIDTSGNLYGGAATGVVGQVTYWTIDTVSIDVTGHIQLASPGGNVALSLTGGQLSASIPQNQLYDTTSRGKVGRLPASACANGQILKWQGNAFLCRADATGSGDGSLSASAAGDGLGYAAGVLSVNVGHGLEVTGDNVQPKLDGATLDTSSAGIKVADLGITADQITKQSITADELANNAVEASELASNAVETAKVRDGAITRPKLSSGVQADLHSASEVERIARREAAQRPLDPLAVFEDVDGTTWAANIEVGGKTLQISDPDDYSSSDDTLGFDFNAVSGETFTAGDVAALQALRVEINDADLDFANAACSRVEIDRGIDCTFPDVAANPWVSGANNDVTFYRPVMRANFMPLATAAQDGDICILREGAQCDPTDAAEVVREHASRASGLVLIESGSVPGLSVVTLGSDTIGSLHQPTPAFDLDTTTPYDHAMGEFHVSGTVTMTDSVATSGRSFVEGTPSGTAASDEDKVVEISQIVLASTLEATSDFPAAPSSSGPYPGVVVIEQQVYANTTDVGDVRMVLAHLANGQVGLFAFWDTESGGTGQVDFSFDLDVTFTPSDAPAGGGGAATPTVYTTLASLPSAASLDTGTMAIVAESTSPFATMTFRVDGQASGSREWRCTGGASSDLVGTAGVRIPAAQAGTLVADRWYTVGSPAATWDFRFQFQRVGFGGGSGPVSAPWWYAAWWYSFDSAAIASLTAGTAGQSSATSGTFLEVSFWQANQDVLRATQNVYRPGGVPDTTTVPGHRHGGGDGNYLDSQSRQRVIRIGRTSTNQILVASRQAVGTMTPNPPHIVPFRVRGSCG